MRALAFIVLFSVGCGQPVKTSAPAPETPLNNEPQETEIETASVERHAYAFRGTITELRQLEPAKKGLPIILEDVVVLSANKRAHRYYVADAIGGEYGGIEVKSCNEPSCRAVLLPPGTTVDVEGVLSVESDQRYVVENARLRLRSNKTSEVPQAELPTPLAAPHEATNGRFVGGYVVLVDAATAEPSRFAIIDLEPEAGKNPDYPEELAASCTLGAVAIDADCCAFGPKYRWFVVEDEATRARVHVSTAMQDTWSVRAWPCTSADLGRMLDVGDGFSKLAGIIDVRDQQTLIMPMSDRDIPPI